jgi:hypothetical protein
MIGVLLDAILDGLAGIFGPTIFKSRVDRLSVVWQFVAFGTTTVGWACVMVALIAMLPWFKEGSSQPTSFWWTSFLAIGLIAVAFFVWVLVAWLVLGAIEVFTANKSKRQDQGGGE